MTALLTDNLPLLAGAPNGIQKLRELILELAVRGKLVPQDPSDEPASELLKRIAEEKARLVAEGKIRKQKPLGEIGEEAKPFAAPAGWEFARLSTVTTKLTDGSHNPPKDSGSGYPMLSSQNVVAGNIRFDNPSRYLSDSDFELEDARTKIQPGDVLLTIVASLGRAAVVPLDAPKFALQRSVAVLASGLCSEFLSVLLNSPASHCYYEANAKGTAQKGIYLGKLGEYVIAVPPLAEQQRIVAKFDELMALCDRLEARQTDAASAHARLVQALLDSLTQASDADDFAASWQRLAEHFHSLFSSESSIDVLKQTLLQLAVMGKLVPQDPSDEPASELLKRIAEEKARLVVEGKIRKQKLLAEIGEEERPFELPAGWEWVRLEEIAEVGTGATPLRTNPKYFEPAEFNWVTSGETDLDFISEVGQKVSALALKETNLTVYPPRTLIMAMYGQGKTRGQISELLVPACTNQACAAIQVVNPDDSHRQYVKFFFIKSYEDIRQMAAGGAQPNLNLGKIKEAVLPIPPMSEQHRIVAKLDELIALCDQLKARLTAARQLHERLAGALVEQAVA